MRCSRDSTNSHSRSAGPMTYRAILLAVVLLSATTARCIAAPGLIAISPDQVADALAAAGLHTESQQITLPASLVARSAHPPLRVGRIESWGDHRFRVRIECSNSTDCLPFFVSVSRAAIPTLDGPKSRPAAIHTASPPASNPVVMRAGSPANLSLEGDHIRVQLAVICLQNGRVGELIRAGSKDRAQSYFAEVIDATHLKGRLQ